jgi:hypothetical protein
MNHNKRPRGRRRFLLIPLFLLLALAGMSLIVMLLWNHIVAPVFNMPILLFWQAGGLLILCRLLFGGFKFGPRSGRGPFVPPAMRDRWRNMSDEERSQFKSEWRKRCDDPEK